MKEPTNKDELQTRFGTHNHLSSNSDALTTDYWRLLLASRNLKNCENIGKILKISCVRYNFVKFDIHFLGHP